MGGGGEIIDLEALDVDFDFAESLGGVGVKTGVVGTFKRADEAGDFGDGLDGAEFVVGEHNGKKLGWGARNVRWNLDLTELVDR